MALPVLQTPMPTFMQANPELQGMQVNQQLQQQAIKNRFLAPMMQAKLKQIGLQAQQMPVQTQLIREQQQAYPQLTQANIDRIHAAIGLTKEQTKMDPLKTLLDAQNQQRLSQRFGPAFTFSKMLRSMPTPIRAQYIAQNPQAFNQMVSGIGNRALSTGTQPAAEKDPYQQQISAMMQKVFPQQGSQPDGASPQQQTPQQQATTQPSIAQSAQAAAGFGEQPNSWQKQELIGLNEANQEAAGGKGGLAVKRAVAASQMEKWLSDNRLQNIKKMNNALQYAGIKGQTKAARDAFLNKNPDALSDYIWFRDQFVPSLSNQYKFIEGMSSTDQQRKEVSSLVNDVSKFSSDPARARMSFNKMVGTLHSLAKADFGAAEPINKGVYKTQYNLPEYTGNYLDASKPLIYPNQADVNSVLSGANRAIQVGAPSQQATATQAGQNYSQEDLEYTAKTHGLTVEQVKQRLGVK